MPEIGNIISVCTNLYTCKYLYLIFLTNRKPTPDYVSFNKKDKMYQNYFILILKYFVYY